MAKRQVTSEKIRQPSGHFSQAIAIEAKGRLVDRIHKVRREYFKSPPPASAMVEVAKFTSPDYLIEISAIALIASE